MKISTSAWMVVCGLAMGVGSVAGVGAPASAAAPLDEKVDLTPKFKPGQKLTFKQHTVRTDTMTLGNVPAPKPEEKPADGGGAGGGGKDEPKKDGAGDGVPSKPHGASGESHLPLVASEMQPASPQPKAGGGAGGSGGGMTQVQKVDQTATYEVRVMGMDEKGTQLEVELKALTASAELPMGKYTWDSASPPDDKDASNPVLQAMRPVVGAIAKVTLGPDGNVTSVTPDERVNLGSRGPLAPMVQSLVGADGVRLRWGSVLWIKDGHEPASVGQAWTNVDEQVFQPVGGKFVYETHNTLKGVSGGVATIEFSGDVKMAPLDAEKPASGSVRDGSIKGSCQWDVAAGAAKKHTWEQKQTLDVNAQGLHVLRKSEMVVETTRE